jgi:hypothetical protein
MAITTMDGLVQALDEGLTYIFYKGALSNTAAGQYHSYWRSAGNPVAPAVPSTTIVYPKSTDPGTFSQGIPTSTKQWYIGQFTQTGSVIGSMIVQDRLAYVGGLSGSSTTAITLGMTSSGPVVDEARCSSYYDADWFMETYVDLGATASSLYVYFTATDGSTGLAKVVISATCRASRMIPIVSTLSSQTIKSVDTVVLQATTGSSGGYGITCARSVCALGNMVANVGYNADFAALGLPKIGNNAHLQLMWIASGTAGPNCVANITLIRG